MGKDKFEKILSSLLNLISVFENEDGIPSKRKRNLDFENDIIKIANETNSSNFKFFANVFDEIFTYQLDNYDLFRNHISDEKGSKQSKFVKEYYSFSGDEREKTIILALKIFGQYKKIQKEYPLHYQNSLPIGIIENKEFDKDFHSKNYEYKDIMFDIFLSHRYVLMIYNILVYYILTVYYGFSVYVDWIFDKSVDRNKISKNTVKLLKYRMNQSNNLVFFNILNTPTTNWMAWEVGYFSCLKQSSIAILDLDNYCKGNKNVEVLSSSETILLDVKSGFYLQKRSISLEDWIHGIKP